MKFPILLSSLCALATAFSAAQILHAQTAPARVMQTANSGNWYVRVATIDGQTLEGRVTQLDKDSAQLTRAKVALSDIATIDHRMRKGGGAVPGAVVGGAVLSVVGYAFVSGMCESNCGRAGLGALFGGAAIGGTIGSVLGAMLSPGRAEWQRVYPQADSLRAAQQRAWRERADTIARSKPRSTAT